MIGNGKALIRCMMVLLIAVLAYGVAPVTAATFNATAESCAPYRGNSLPSNTCSFSRYYDTMYRALNQQQRTALTNNTSAVSQFYSGSFGVSGNVTDCFRVEQDKINACKTYPPNANENTRIDNLLQQLLQQSNQEQAALRRARDAALASAEAAQAAARSSGGSSASGGSIGGIGSAVGSSLARTARSPGCAENVAQATDQGATLGLARAATIFDRTIMNVSARAAVEAAMCIDRLMDKINEVTTAFNAIISSLNNPLIAILVGIASQLLGQIITQLIDNVMNAVCNAADEIYSAIDNRLKNALCIKGDTNGFDPMDFKIDIKAMECSGWSIDLLSGQVLGQPIEGVNVNWNQVGQAGTAALNSDRMYATQAQAIINNRNLNDAQRNEQLLQLCRSYGRTDCGN